MKRLVLILAITLVACATDRDPSTLFAPQVDGVLVIDAVLIVGETMPALRLTQTIRPDRPWSEAIALVDTAVITIVSAMDTIRYRGNRVSASWAYYPVNGAVVQPSTTYRIDVSVPDGRHLTATTTTPPAFRAGEWVLLNDAGIAVDRRLLRFDDVPGNPDSVYASPQNQLVYSRGLLEARVVPGTAKGYVAALFSLTPGSDYVIDPEILDEFDESDFPRINNSPPLDAASGSVRLPWLAIYYAGKYLIKVYSVDRNWYDLARTDPSINGGGGGGFGGPAGDNFNRPIFHVEGGIGLFGSASVDSIGVVIHPRS